MLRGSRKLQALIIQLLQSFYINQRQREYGAFDAGVVGNFTKHYG